MLSTYVKRIEKAIAEGKDPLPEEVIRAISLAGEYESEAKSAKKKIQTLLATHYADTTAKLFKEKGSDTGTVSQIKGQHVLKIERKKKVMWDQDSLQVLIDLSRGSSQYIKSKLSVSEADYALLDDDAREEIDPARTVEDGDPTFKFEERK